MTHAARFRGLLRHDGTIVAPGAYVHHRTDDRACQVRVRRQSANPERVRVFGKRLLQCHSAYFSTSDQTPFHSADGAVTRN